MSEIKIIKVESKKQLKKFVDLHYDLYEGNEYDAPNLFDDDMNTLSEDKNAAFDFCKAEYYLAYKDGKLVGRVAAIINEKANTRWEQKNVRFGWLDMIDDLDVTKALMQAVEDFGRRNGMTHIVGPLGFTDMDPEGMLTEGFDQLGTMATIYNYPYYPEHFKQLEGFNVDNRYVEFKMPVPDSVPEKFQKISAMIEKRYNLHVYKPTKKEILEQGLGEKVFRLINDSYKDLYGYSELSDRQIHQYCEMYLKMLDPEFITGIVDGNKDNELIGVGITMASLSRALQKCRRGRLFPFGWWHILRALFFKKTEGVDLLLIAIKPEYRSKGANALLFSDLIPRYIKYGWKWGETQVELESNKNVQGQWDLFEPLLHKRRVCWKKEI